MNYSARYVCFEGCGFSAPLSDVVYKCPKCNALLDVSHDLDALAQHSAEEWKKRFEKRWMKTIWPYGSGVWGKMEWVYPGLAHENIVSFAEGGTNLMWAKRLGELIGVSDLWVKMCGNTHTGSFKDLGMTVLVSAVNQMIADGAPIRAVACASTGDTSAALSAYCASAGIPCIVFLPKNKISPAQLVQPMANGAVVVSLETDFDGCMSIVQEMTADGSIYLANSMNSLRLEGQKTISVELVQQFDWEVPDFVVVPGGNLGNIYAFSKGFLMMEALGLIDKRPTLVCAQSANNNPLYKAYLNDWQYEPQQSQSTVASAIQIGSPVSIHRAIRALKEFDGIVVDATEDEIMNAAAEADLSGMFTCPHTGVALAGTKKLIASGVIQKDHRVVVVSTAHGLKFSGVKTGYHTGTLAGISSNYRNVPLELPAEADAVRRALDSALPS